MSSGSASSCADGGPPYVDAARVAAAVPMADAVRAVEDALRGPAPDDPPRTAVDVAAGQLLLMPSQSAHAVGVKLAAVAPGNPGLGLDRIQGVYVLLDGRTLVPTLLVDGVALTNLRTPAVSAVSAAWLAVPDAAELVVFGSGPQAWGHVLAMRTVRPVRRVRVVGRDAGRAADLVGRVRHLGLEADVATAGAICDADIVCLCTTARTPLFDGQLLPEHAHVVAVGSHEPDAREVDATTLARSYLVVEDRATALLEAGDVVLALQERAIGHDHLRADLRELVADSVDHAQRLTLFKSVGMAWEDLAVAELVKRRCA
jgi:ornithine cyclodeaminase/alanine dehydrogenase-like protein (mu-crystallin family)